MTARSIWDSLNKEWLTKPSLWAVHLSVPNPWLLFNFCHSNHVNLSLSLPFHLLSVLAILLPLCLFVSDIYRYFFPSVVSENVPTPSLFAHQPTQFTRTVYPNRPGRSSQSPSYWMGSICELPCQVSPQMIYRDWIWALAQPLKNSQTFVESWLMLRVIIVLKGESSPQSQVTFILPSSLTSLLVSAAEKPPIACFHNHSSWLVTQF